MFGDNPIRKIIHQPDELAVEASFYTIQGEGPYSGMPALFVRLAGCNLACHFCDTEFESNVLNPVNPVAAAVDLMERFTPQQRRFVVLTGGEPLRQNALHLIEALLANGTELIQIETAGTVWQPSLDYLFYSGRVVLVCSPKTPRIHPKIALHCLHYKYIIRAGELDAVDGLPNRGTQRSNKGVEQRLYRPDMSQHPLGHHLTSPSRITIWVSPCDDYDAEANAANLLAVTHLALTFGYRVSLQVHKILAVE